MLAHLTDIEARVIGSLMEKSIVTPDQYPLTLNSLTNACNQKSARDPVMSLNRGEVQRTARALKDKSLMLIEENFKTGTEKYKQRLCNTTFNEFQFEPQEFAIVCLLLLRGPQTPGELRTRSGRLHSFANNEDVVAALRGLTEPDKGGEPLVVQLPRTPGRRDSEYMHQLCGVIDKAAYEEKAVAKKSDSGVRRGRVAELEQRVRELEAENAELRERLKNGRETHVMTSSAD